MENKEDKYKALIPYIGFENLMDFLDVIVHTGIKDKLIQIFALKFKDKSENDIKTMDTFSIAVDLIVSILDELTLLARKEPELIYGFFGKLFIAKKTWQEVKALRLSDLANIINFIKEQTEDIAGFFDLLVPKQLEAPSK